MSKEGNRILYLDIRDTTTKTKDYEGRGRARSGKKGKDNWKQGDKKLRGH